MYSRRDESQRYGPMYMFRRGASRSRPLWRQNPNDRHRRRHLTAFRVGKFNWRADDLAGSGQRRSEADDLARVRGIVDVNKFVQRVAGFALQPAAPKQHSQALDSETELSGVPPAPAFCAKPSGVEEAAV